MRLVIVGGVAGGMSAAARYRRLDENAEIVVLERGGEVSFANCGLPYYVGGEIVDEASLLVATPESLRASLDIDVRTRTEAVALDAERRELTVRTAEGESTLAYDELLLSPDEFAIVHKLRRLLAGLDSQAAIDLLIAQLKKTRSNVEFLMQVSKNAPGVAGD